MVVLVRQISEKTEKKENEGKKGIEEIR